MINAQEAIALLDAMPGRVQEYKRDNTDKLRSYKLTSAKKTEFAFDPKTTTGLFVWVGREPPLLPGLSDIERVSGKDVSTALGRVFSGGLHKANFKVNVDDADALRAFIAHYETV